MLKELSGSLEFLLRISADAASQKGGAAYLSACLNVGLSVLLGVLMGALTNIGQKALRTMKRP